MRRIALLPLFLIGFLLSNVLPCSAQSDFDARNKEGLSRNPSGVRFLLRTRDGRLTFHLFETIPIELAFNSSRPSTYTIEFDEAMNFAGSAHKVEVEPESAVLLTWSEWSKKGVICCSSDRRYLSKQETVFNRELTDYIRFEAAGTYRIFFSTRRVFDRPSKYDDFRPSEITLTSNVLTLNILPDDNGWDARQLSETLSKLQDIHVKANHDATERAIKTNQPASAIYEACANRLAWTEFVRAQKALNAMDSEDAIRARVKLMEMTSKEYISSERESGGGTVLWQPLLASTTRPGAVVAALKSQAEDPEFGVGYDYVDWWARYIVMRDRTELFRPFRDETEHQERIRSFLEGEIAAKRDIALSLESRLSDKKAAARSLTELTIKTLKAELAYKGK